MSANHSHTSTPSAGRFAARRSGSVSGRYPSSRAVSNGTLSNGNTVERKYRLDKERQLYRARIFQPARMWIGLYRHLGSYPSRVAIIGIADPGSASSAPSDRLFEEPFPEERAIKRPISATVGRSNSRRLATQRSSRRSRLCLQQRSSPFPRDVLLGDGIPELQPQAGGDVARTQRGHHGCL
jgi:hypothetical protein